MRLAIPRFDLRPLLAALLLAACATPDSRIKDDPAGYSGLTAEQQAQVRKGEVAIGMPEKAVRLALGKPDKVTESTDATRSLRVWHYQNYQGSQSVGFGTVIGGPHYGFFPEVIVSTPQPVTDRVRVVFSEGKVISIEREID
jgi:hypothetical protein